MADATTGWDPLAIGLIGALAGSVLTFIGDAWIQRRNRRRTFRAHMRALANELKEVREQSKTRLESTDPYPTGPALPTADWQTIKASGEIFLIENRYRQLSDLYRDIDSANHSASLGLSFAEVAALASDKDVSDSFRVLAEKFSKTPFTGIPDLCDAVLQSSEFRKWVSP